MNSIGVDFKLKQVELDEKIVKLQIVKYKITSVGYSRPRKIPYNNYKLL
jgi:hypothetical protein